MRIVHFSWEYPPRIVGGLGTFATEITKKFAEKGHEITVFTMNDGNRFSTRDAINGVEVHRPLLIDFSDMYSLYVGEELRNWGRGLKFFSDIVTYNTLSSAKLVNDIIKNKGKKFDIIHSHDWLGIYGGIATRKETGIPLVFHIHSTEKGRSQGMGSHTVEKFEYKGFSEADIVVTVSNAMKKELETLGMNEKVEVCWNGVDANKYDPSKVNRDEVSKLKKRYGIKEGENVILFVGRLVGVKGVDKLVRALPLVLKRFPNTKLVILGKGGMETDLTNLAKSLGIASNVIFRFEFVPETERIIHYAMSDVAVFPSLYEPFGIVCTEAMSMEKPVVVGAHGTSGMTEQVRDSGPDECGRYVDPRYPEDIARGINEILEIGPEDRKVLGVNGRKRVLNYFTWDHVYERLLNIYKKVAK